MSNVTQALVFQFLFAGDATARRFGLDYSQVQTSNLATSDDALLRFEPGIADQTFLRHAYERGFLIAPSAQLPPPRWPLYLVGHRPAGSCQFCGRWCSAACGHCRIIMYCGYRCQDSDWKRHEPLCGSDQALAVHRPLGGGGGGSGSGGVGSSSSSSSGSSSSSSSSNSSSSSSSSSGSSSSSSSNSGSNTGYNSSSNSSSNSTSNTHRTRDTCRLGRPSRRSRRRGRTRNHTRSRSHDHDRRRSFK
jgi:hypothetical protein